MKRLLASLRRDERGVIIIWTAFFLMMMLMFIALGIDVAKLMATRTQLQNAADASALAGASSVNFQTGNIVPDTAVTRAQWTALQNEAFVNGPSPVLLSAADVSFPTTKECRVVVRRNPAAGGSMVTHVAQVLGIKSLEMSATATAKADLASEQCEKLVPMGAIPPGNGTNFQVGCANTYTLFQGQGGGTNGNWQAVDFPPCDEGPCAGYPQTGANTFRCLLTNGYACCVWTGQIIQTEPGQMNGPARQGLQDRFDRDTDRRNNICYSEYTGNRSRIVNVPIIRSLGAGRSDIQVTGFAAFFLKERPTGGPAAPVKAEFLYDVVPGSGGGSNGTVFVLRLIH